MLLLSFNFFKRSALSVESRQCDTLSGNHRRSVRSRPWLCVMAEPPNVRVLNEKADDPSAEGIEYPKGEHGEGFDDPNDLGIVPSPVTEAGERDISTETESVPSNGRLPATFRKAFMG
uniref:Uncharacterized protein n=1 Tax=Ascaris lumbricoides TaxID=6252 RepID=A0A0M3IFS0_ASCLU